MQDPDSTRVEWVRDPSVADNEYSVSDQDQGNGFMPDPNPKRLFYQQVTIHDKQVYIQMDDPTKKALDSMRTVMPAFQMVSHGMVRLGNLHGDILASGTHGQASRGKPIHPVFGLNSIPLTTFKKECNAARATKEAKQLDNRRKKDREAEEKRLKAVQKDETQKAFNKTLQEHKAKQQIHQRNEKRTKELSNEVERLQEQIHKGLSLSPSSSQYPNATQLEEWRKRAKNIENELENILSEERKNNTLTQDLETRLITLIQSSYDPETIIKRHKKYKTNMGKWKLANRKILRARATLEDFLETFENKINEKVKESRKFSKETQELLVSGLVSYGSSEDKTRMNDTASFFDDFESKVFRVLRQTQRGLNEAEQQEEEEE